MRDGGGGLQAGGRDAVFHAPSSPAAARLLGVRNLLAGVVVSVAGGTTLIDAGGLSATVRLADAAVGTPVTLGVRAQDVIALPAPDRGDGAGTATLEREVDAGIRRTLALRLPGGAEIQAELDRDLSRKLGRTLPQRWHVQVADDTAMAWQGHSP